MELPLLVDFLYVNRGRVSNTLAAGTPENVPSLAHRGVFNCQPSVTMANYLWEPCLHCITGLSRHHCTVKRWRITICHSSQVLPSERPRLWKELFSNRGDGVGGGDRSAAAQECHTTIGFPVTAFLDETGEGAAVQGLIVTMVTVTDSLRERWKMMIWLPSSRTSASDDSKKQKKVDASTVRRLFKPEYCTFTHLYTHSHTFDFYRSASSAWPIMIRLSQNYYTKTTRSHASIKTQNNHH